MRSYQSHIEDIQTKNPDFLVFRASSLFPVKVSSQVKCRILFMGYWQVKRGIKEIACVLTLRSEKGKLLYRKVELIDSAKAYEYTVSSLLKEGGCKEQEFIGSLEVEFFSHVHLVFPFPAVVVNYYGKDFNSFVHTAQRVYNNFSDKEKNSSFQTPESGFSIRCTPSVEPFFAFVNGPVEMEKSLLPIEVIREDKTKHLFELPLKALQPYETCFIYPARKYPLEEFLQGSIGTIKLGLSLPWVFPRILCGNRGKRATGFSLTHSYYDQSSLEENSAYWAPRHEEKFVESLSVPLVLEESYDTFLTFYPIYSPSQFTVSFEAYSSEGECLAKVPAIYTQKKESSLQRISCKKLLKELCDIQKVASARVCLDPIDKVPARVKIALDIAKEANPLCCNICTNLQPYIPDFESKPQTFRWFPLFADTEGAHFFIINGSVDKAPTRRCQVQMTFYRQKDGKTKEKTFSLPPQGIKRFSLDEDLELKAFFHGKTGWATATISNPYATTYSFVFHQSGSIGGDHGF